MNASRQMSPGGAETPILPRGDTTEQPLLVILATMAFLAGVTLMVTLMGFARAHHGKLTSPKPQQSKYTLTRMTIAAS